MIESADDLAPKGAIDAPADLAEDPGKFRALKTFSSSEFGMIRAGSTVWLPPGYAKQMLRRGNIAPHAEDKRAPQAKPLAPAHRQAHPGAPLGKEQPAPGSIPADTPAPASPAPPTEAPPAAGQARPSVVSQPARASRRRMSTGAGAKPK